MDIYQLDYILHEPEESEGRGLAHSTGGLRVSAFGMGVPGGAFVDALQTP